MSLTTAATREIIFDVEGYSVTKLMSDGRGGYFQSDKFTVGGYVWAVRYCPDRVGLYVSVTLVLLSELKDAGQEVGVSFACALQNWLGERSRTRASYVFSGHGQEMGFWRYARHDVLENPDIIVDDCFTLVCTVSVLRKLIMRD